MQQFIKKGKMALKHSYSRGHLDFRVYGYFDFLELTVSFFPSRRLSEIWRRKKKMKGLYRRRPFSGMEEIGSISH